MNFNFLYLHHMMNQLNGAHHHPLGLSLHHQSRFQEPLPPVQQTRERLTEMQKCVTASLAQLKPYPVPVPDMVRRRYSDTETPQDLSLRYPIKHEHETCPSPDAAMAPPPPVKTEPDDPGYRIHEHLYPAPPPAPDHLSRSYSLPARDSGDLSEARLVNTVRQRSLDRATGHSSRESKAGGSRDKEEVNSSRTIIGIQ